MDPSRFNTVSYRKRLHVWRNGPVNEIQIIKKDSKLNEFLFPKLNKKVKSWSRMGGPGKAWKRAWKGLEKGLERHGRVLEDWIENIEECNF